MKKLLIVVDYQYDFVEGALGFSKAKTIETIIEDKIKTTISQKQDLIFTLDTHDENYLQTQEGKRLPVLHCIENTKGHELFGSIKKYQSQAVGIFKKTTFGSLALGNFLKDQAYDEIEVCGLVTNMCVISNAIIAKAARPEARIVVDHLACLSFDEDLHEKTLAVLKGMQVDVI